MQVGGEGGLLDNAVVQGGTHRQGFDTGYGHGEILLPPGSRADVVAAIPASATGVLTMWTEDYNRTGAGFPDTPTVPVMHLNVAGAPVSPAYTIADGTPLRAATGDPVAVVGPATGTLLDPSTFSPAKLGLASQDHQAHPDGKRARHRRRVRDHGRPLGRLHRRSAPTARPGTRRSATRWSYRPRTRPAAHHPFHLHGFSMQPISLTKPGGPNYVWPYHEFRDNIDIPGGLHAPLPDQDHRPSARRRRDDGRRLRPLALPLPHLLPRHERHARRARRRAAERQRRGRTSTRTTRRCPRTAATPSPCTARMPTPTTTRSRCPRRSAASATTAADTGRGRTPRAADPSQFVYITATDPAASMTRLPSSTQSEHASDAPPARAADPGLRRPRSASGSAPTETL